MRHITRYLAMCIAACCIQMSPASRCPFHQISAGVKRGASRVLSEGDQASSHFKTVETTDPSWLWQSSQLLSWLVNKVGWVTEGSDGKANERWDYNRLTQLEAHWDEAQPWKTKIVLVGDDFSRLRLPLTFRPYENTEKALHSSGSYGRVEFRWTDDRFREQHTGIFSDLTAEAIMSGSGGNPYVGNQSAAFGWGFKFFRTNAQPASILSLNAFLGKGACWNIFGFMTCSHVSLAEMAALIPTTIGWSKFPNQNGLSNVGIFNSNGRKFHNPQFPYSLCFKPNPLLTQRVGSPVTLSPLSSLHAQMGLIQPGDHLFDVVAIFHPKVLEQPNLLLNPNYARHVGNVVALTSFSRSQFGDSRLFFPHQAFDDDLVLRPDWLPYMNLRNMIREGALGTYRVLYSPPILSIQNQIIALRSLARFLIRLLTQADPNALQTLGITGRPSFLDLLRMYMKQGGPTALRIIAHQPFPKSPLHRLIGEDNLWRNGASISTYERQQMVQEWLSHVFNEHVVNNQIDAEMGLRREVHDFSVETFVTDTDPIGYAENSDHHLNQNWPSTTPDSIVNDDTFLASWQRSLLLTKYLAQYYIQRRSDTNLKVLGIPAAVPSQSIFDWIWALLNYGTEVFSTMRIPPTERTANPFLTESEGREAMRQLSSNDSAVEHNEFLPDGSNAWNPTPPYKRENNPSFNIHVSTLDAFLIPQFLHDLSAILRTPFALGRRIKQFDPKLVVIHLIEPVFGDTIYSSGGQEDAVFQKLMAVALGLSSAPPQHK